MHLAIQEYSRSTSRLVLMAMLGAAMAIGALAAIGQASEPVCRLEAVTSQGELYILGVGDTCKAAFVNHAPYPDDWTEIRFNEESAQ